MVDSWDAVGLLTNNDTPSAWLKTSGAAAAFSGRDLVARYGIGEGDRRLRTLQRASGVTSVETREVDNATMAIHTSAATQVDAIRVAVWGAMYNREMKGMQEHSARVAEEKAARKETLRLPDGATGGGGGGADEGDDGDDGDARDGDPLDSRRGFFYTKELTAALRQRKAAKEDAAAAREDKAQERDARRVEKDKEAKAKRAEKALKGLFYRAVAFLKEKQAYGKQIMKGALTNVAALPKTKQLHKDTLQLRKEDIGLEGWPAFRGAFEAAVEACAAAREAERIEREVAAATAAEARRSTKRARVPSPKKKGRAATNKENRGGNQRRVGRA